MCADEPLESPTARGPASSHGGASSRAARYVLEDSLGFLVNQASRSIRRRFDEELAARGLGVTGEQFGLLVHLWRADGQHQKDLAAILAKDKTTMARLVQGLEARGLVVRVADPVDLRHKRVYLSERGRADIAGLLEAATTVLDEVATAIDAHDLAVCKDVLRAVHRQLAGSAGDRVPAVDAAPHGRESEGGMG